MNVAQDCDSNEDGWFEDNARTLFSRLTTAGHDVILSAPSLDRSGSGSIDIFPKPPPKYHGCEYKSCPSLSPAIGYNASNPRLNYVNSYPITNVRIGLQRIASTPWSTTALADLVVSGVNVGYNFGWQVYGSGTDNVAMYAPRHGVPALAFPGHEGVMVG
ncbi:hypothetical protein DPSP01_011669 [Paraphaeosphaeria sporulosa]|uniref:Sure-like protein n=1 Tax=Paraphaeosphaeria sporulosa TaxID=1460663 RepID=A0A177CX36_9PLEO|nr:sure-like protein [Paraphaeosphaeria sporulosa]OAG12115.1 sure-like protein [Paraphaeosphaeria sporulosa]